jgi:hypothetical protein
MNQNKGDPLGNGLNKEDLESQLAAMKQLIDQQKQLQK